MMIIGIDSFICHTDSHYFVTHLDILQLHVKMRRLSGKRKQLTVNYRCDTVT